MRRSRGSIPARHDAVVNVQGDLPMLNPAAIRVAVAGLAESDDRHRNLGGGDRRPGGARRYQRQQGRCRVCRSGPAGSARSISARRSCRGGRGRITSISGSTLIAAPRSTVSSRCRAACSNSASGSSSCARSKPGCGSRSAWSTRRWLGVQVDTPADLARARELMRACRPNTRFCRQLMHDRRTPRGRASSTNWSSS